MEVAYLKGGVWIVGFRFATQPQQEPPSFPSSLCRRSPEPLLPLISGGCKRSLVNSANAQRVPEKKRIPGGRARRGGVRPAFPELCYRSNLEAWQLEKSKEAFDVDRSIASCRSQVYSQVDSIPRREDNFDALEVAIVSRASRDESDEKALAYSLIKKENS